VSALALALALASQQPLGSWQGAPGAAAGPPSWYRPWRLVETTTLHIAARPGVYLDNEARGGLELAGGGTIQISWLGVL
jgi:hypothetical protein